MYMFCSQTHVLDNQEPHCGIYKYYVFFDTIQIGYIHPSTIKARDFILVWHSENLVDKGSYSEHLECLCNLWHFNLLKKALKFDKLYDKSKFLMSAFTALLRGI